MSRVLVVDDEPVIIELFTSMLDFGGHEVVGTASDGEEAVQRFEEVFPACDIVLMDHRMPRKSGAEATREITTRHPEAKVLMVTADETIKSHAELNGAVGCIEKPVDIDGLLRAVDEALGGERAAITELP